MYCLIQNKVCINCMDLGFNQEEKGPEYLTLFPSVFPRCSQRRFLKWNKKHLSSVVVKGRFLTVSAGQETFIIYFKNGLKWRIFCHLSAQKVMD